MVTRYIFIIYISLLLIINQSQIKRKENIMEAITTLILGVAFGLLASIPTTQAWNLGIRGVFLIIPVASTIGLLASVFIGGALAIASALLFTALVIVFYNPLIENKAIKSRLEKMHTNE